MLGEEERAVGNDEFMVTDCLPGHSGNSRKGSEWVMHSLEGRQSTIAEDRGRNLQRKDIMAPPRREQRQPSGEAHGRCGRKRPRLWSFP